MIELYGIDLILSTRLGPMVMRVPGWVNFSVLQQWQPRIKVLKRGKR